MITILSRNNAIRRAHVAPDHPIIAIGETHSDDVLRLADVAKNCLLLRFDDVETARDGCVTADHVRQALDWAADKGDLSVACRAGISRSAALAYLIAAVRSTPKEATAIWDMDLHQPNRLVVKVGSQLLNDPAIQEAYDLWMAKVYRRLLSGE